MEIRLPGGSLPAAPPQHAERRGLGTLETGCRWGRATLSTWSISYSQLESRELKLEGDDQMDCILHEVVTDRKIV